MTTSTLTRIGFAGTPEFAAAVLGALCANGRAPVAVWTQPDRRAGRGRKLTASAVKQRASADDIPVFQPQTLKSSDAQTELREQQLDILIVVAYGLILPQVVLDTPVHGCLNIHASLLPRWRGAAPIQAAIAAGDETTGVCIMQMEAGLDTGPVLACTKTNISASDTAATLTTRLSELGATTLLAVLQQVEQLQLNPVRQDDAATTYAGRIQKTDAALDFRRPATELARAVRAYDPWPVAYTTLDGERVRIWSAQTLPGPVNCGPGTLMNCTPDGLDVATGDGVLRIVELQRAGGKRVSAADFLHARKPRPGCVLGA